MRDKRSVSVCVCAGERERERKERDGEKIIEVERLGNIE